MNFITLHRAGTRPGAAMLINVANIVAVEEMSHGTVITPVSDGSILVHEKVEEIRALLNPMSVFTGKRDVGEAPEQDTRTQLLIEAMWLLYGSTIPGAKWLYDAIKREVGEAAIEQYEATGRKTSV